MSGICFTFSEFGILVGSCAMFYLIGCFRGVNYNYTPPKKRPDKTKSRKTGKEVI